MESPTSSLDLTRLTKSANATVNPLDYFGGVLAPEHGLPGRILCFTRKNGAELMSNQIQSHHHRCVLVTALSGQGVVCLDATNVQLKEGESLLIFPFQFHSYMDIPRGEVCWAFTTFEMPTLEDLEVLEPLRFSPRPLSETDIILLGEILSTWQNEDHHSLLGLHLGLFLRRLALAKAPGKKPLRAGNSAGADLLARVNHYVLPRLSKAISLEELGRALGQSESHLRARFRAVTNTSLGSHLRLLRIQKACYLLHSTDSPIAGVAEKCGFDSVYSFSRTFKKIWGISPRAYRQRRF